MLKKVSLVKPKEIPSLCPNFGLVVCFAVMEVSPQDPSLMAMDLSKGYSVTPLTRSHADAMDLAKKPEWYHRRPPSCSTDIGSSYRSRASSSYNSLPAQCGPEAGVRCRDIEQRSEALGSYMNSTLTPRLDLYHDRVHGNLWYPGFYGPDESGEPGAESSVGEESDSGSDVIVLVSSTKEPLICSSFIQDSVRHIVEPLSPAVSSQDEGRGCYHLPQPLSSPSPDSSYSEDSSDSSVDIPVHHARPVVLLSDLSAVYGNAAGRLVDISSDDSDVVEVSVTNEKKKTLPYKKTCKKSRETPESEDEKAPFREIKRSPRIRKHVSKMSQFSRSVSRHSLRRRAKSDAVGMYYESCDSDVMMEYALRLSSSDESVTRADEPRRASSNSDESDMVARTDRKCPSKSRQEETCKQKPSNSESINHKEKTALPVHETERLRGSKQKQNHRISTEPRQKASASRSVAVNKKTVSRRKRKRRPQTGPSALFSPREPEIKLKYASVKDRKKANKYSFCPFVHLERRVWTVVNSQEEEAVVRSSRGKQQTASSLSGFVPTTSCFQLGRLSSECRGPSTLPCCLCGQMANITGLGDLHGPYYPAGLSADRHSQQHKQEAQRLPHSVYLSDNDSSAVNSESPKVPPRLDEGWIHEDCGIWTAGVFLIRGKLYGLEEAARLAQETVSDTCRARLIHKPVIDQCFI